MVGFFVYTQKFKEVNCMFFIQLVAEVPAGKLVEAHGTFSTASCIRCQKSYDGEQIKVQCQEMSTHELQKIFEDGIVLYTCSYWLLCWYCFIGTTMPFECWKNTSSNSLFHLKVSDILLKSSLNFGPTMFYLSQRETKLTNIFSGGFRCSGWGQKLEWGGVREWGCELQKRSFRGSLGP